MPETPEEKKVQAIVQKAIEKTKAVDETSYQQGPAAKPALPGGSGFIDLQPGQRGMAEMSNAHQKEVIRQEVLDQSAEVIKGAPTANQTKAFRIADEFAYTEINPPEQGKDKSVSEWQDQFMRKLGNEKEKQEQSKNEKPPMSMSQRFAASLGYNHISKTDEQPDRLKEMKTNGKDMTQEQQPMTTSQRFAASLNYNNANKADERSDRLKEMKTNGRDMTKE